MPARPSRKEWPAKSTTSLRREAPPEREQASRRARRASPVQKQPELLEALEKLEKQSRELRDARTKNNALHERLLQAEQKHSNEQLQNRSEMEQLSVLLGKMVGTVEEGMSRMSEENELLKDENNALHGRLQQAEQRYSNEQLRSRKYIQQRAAVQEQIMGEVKEEVDQLRKENELLKEQYEARLARYDEEIADVEREAKETIGRLGRANAQLTNQLHQLMTCQAKPITIAGLGAATLEKEASERPRTANVKPMTVPTGQQAATVTLRRISETSLASIRPMAVGSRTTANLPTRQTANDSRLDRHDAPLLPSKPRPEMCEAMHAQECSSLKSLPECDDASTTGSVSRDDHLISPSRPTTGLHALYHWVRSTSNKFRRVVWDRAKDGPVKASATRANAQQDYCELSDLAPSQPEIRPTR
ncbi:uncharacterized protein LOC128276844, partial [Anopheles cruzii]|uniref:uncharacterized protein LOC128276841 n=1 Tax=Anopheles cruzii TaxID=68878 RepID=UPI0022EC45F4